MNRKKRVRRKEMGREKQNKMNRIKRIEGNGIGTEGKEIQRKGFQGKKLGIEGKGFRREEKKKCE